MSDTIKYYFQASFPSHTTKDHCVELIKRPKIFVIEEGARIFPFVTKYFWPEEKPDESLDIFKIFIELYSDRSKDMKTFWMENFYGTGVLRGVNQHGELVEHWRFGGLWAESINFGYLDYSTRADVEIQVSWKSRYVNPEMPKGSTYLPYGNIQ